MMFPTRTSMLFWVFLMERYYRYLMATVLTVYMHYQHSCVISTPETHDNICRIFLYRANGDFV